jgi:hypothetical protein
MEVPLPVDDGRVSRCRVHGMLSHSAVGMYERVVAPKIIGMHRRRVSEDGAIVVWC